MTTTIKIWTPVTEEVTARQGTLPPSRRERANLMFQLKWADATACQNSSGKHLKWPGTKAFEFEEKSQEL